jgi:putative toxin-antitoxin system antitoxin component (TIGR02293 family)
MTEWLIMSDTAVASGPEAEFKVLLGLFGGPKVLKHKLTGPLDAHEMILEGIPSLALERLVSGLVLIKPSDAFEKAFGMSERTFQRHKADPGKFLNQEQSSRTWNFAKILAKATSVLGTQEEAERWIVQPAMGLDDHRPIDLLATPAGAGLVEDFLERLDYGVYA